jgi:hypothetical protein
MSTTATEAAIGRWSGFWRQGARRPWQRIVTGLPDAAAARSLTTCCGSVRWPPRCRGASGYGRC